MKPQATDRLIADVLAMGIEIQQHLEDRRRHLTTQQIEALSSAISALTNYFAVWKAHELTAGRDVGRKSKRVMVMARGIRSSRKN